MGIINSMTNDTPRPAAASRDDYSLTIMDVAARYEAGGFPRTIRTLQRYCAKGHLDAIKQETPFGDQFLITPASVARHLAQIAEFAAAVSRDEPGPAEAHVAAQSKPIEIASTTTTDTVQPRPAAASPDESRYVAALERENDFLREQVKVKDTQIGELTERARETNHLIAGLQKMLTPLLGRSSGDTIHDIGSAAG